MQLTLNTTHTIFLQTDGLEQAQAAAAVCQGIACGVEGLHVLIVALLLLSAISSIVTAMNFFREDKEEQITPLCPELVLEEETDFAMALHGQTESTEVIGFKHRCRVVIDYPDPFRPNSAGVVATVRLVSDRDILATVVVRNVSMQGQGLALCRGGNDIFGFVEPDYASRRYHVRHRTSVHMLTLAGDFDKMNVGFFNPARVQVGSASMEGETCTGRVLQQVDAGLLLSSFLGAFVHRRLTTAPAPSSGPALSPEVVAALQGQVQPDVLQSHDVEADRGDSEANPVPQSVSEPARSPVRSMGEDGEEEWLA